MSRFVWRWALVALLAALLMPAGARAEEPAKVVLLGTADDPVLERLRDELLLLELRVEVLSRDSGGDLAAIGDDRGARAVARVATGAKEIVIWVAPADRQATDPDTLRVGEPSSGSEPALLALRAVELLRGRLVPVPSPPRPEPPPNDPEPAPAPAPSVVSPSAAPIPPAPAPVPAAPVPATPVASMSAPTVSAPDHPAPPPARARPTTLALGPALTASPGGMPVMASIRLTGGYRFWQRLGAEGFLVAPTIVARLEEPEGVVELRVLSFGGALSVSLTDPVDDLRVSLSVGAAALSLIHGAESTSMAEGTRGTRWSTFPRAGVAVSYPIIPLLAIRADFEGGVVLPQPIVRVVGREVASFGLPLMIASLGVEVRL